MDPQRLVYDWNRAAGEGRPRHLPVELVDETLRDGLQSPSAVTPTLDEKSELIVLMERLGIDTAVIGIPAAGGMPMTAVSIPSRSMRTISSDFSSSVGVTADGDWRPSRSVSSTSSTGRCRGRPSPAARFQSYTRR